MAPARALLILGAVALAAAGTVALVARTPAAVRRSEPPPGATEPSLGARFEPRTVARHGAFRRISYTALGLTIVVQVAALVILARGPLAGWVSAVERIPGGLVVHAAVVGGAVALALTLAQLPLAYVQGYVVQHDWGLSTQDLGGWLSDRARASLVRLVIAAIAAVAFYVVVRWQPRAWWLLGWAVFSLLTAALAFLWPLFVAPLFNRFTPLDGGPLRDRVLALAGDAGVDVGEVYVIDASRRSTIENAYVAGLGSSKRVVLYDTLLASGDLRETSFIVAHELGHQVENHVRENVLLSSAGLLLGFGSLALAARWEGLWSWAGASSIGDLRSLPVLLLVVAVMNVIGLPVENTISRAHEMRADEIALELTDDPDTAVRVFRHLAFANLADLDPPRPVVWALFSHPSIPERIRHARASR